MSCDASTSIWPIYLLSYKVSSLTSLSVHKCLFTARIDPVICQYPFRNALNFEPHLGLHVLAEQVWSVWLWLYDRLTHKLDFYNTRLPEMLLLNAIKPVLWLLDSCNGLVLVEILLFLVRTVSSNFKWRFIRLISSVPLHGIYCMIFLPALFSPIFLNTSSIFCCISTAIHTGSANY